MDSLIASWIEQAIAHLAGPKAEEIKAVLAASGYAVSVQVTVTPPVENDPLGFLKALWKAVDTPVADAPAAPAL